MKKKKSKVESVTKRVATCSQFLERGEDYSLFDSRNFIIYVAIYADAISLVISACMNGWKKKLRYRQQRIVWNEEGLQKHVSFNVLYTKETLFNITYTAWSIAQCVYWADVMIWRLRTTSIRKLESTLVHRVTWRSPWEIIADTNCRYLSKRNGLYEQWKIYKMEYLLRNEYKDNFISIGPLTVSVCTLNATPVCLDSSSVRITMTETTMYVWVWQMYRRNIPVISPTRRHGWC